MSKHCHLSVKMSSEQYIASAEENIKMLYSEIEKWRTKAETAVKAEMRASFQLTIYKQCMINERNNFKLCINNLRDQLKLSSVENSTLTARLKELELKNISDRRQASLQMYRREYLARQQSVCDCPASHCATDGSGEDEID